LITLAPGTKVYCPCRPVDLRNGFDGLAAKVQWMICADPLNGHMFIFRGKRGNYFKGLYWDGSGLWLIAKRLEKGRTSKSSGMCVQNIPARLATLLPRRRHRRCRHRMVAPPPPRSRICWSQNTATTCRSIGNARFTRVKVWSWSVPPYAIRWDKPLGC